MFTKSHGIRAVIAKVSPGKLQRVTASGRPRESHADRELWQQYGHASWPLPGAEGIMLFLNGDVNNAHMIATEDRRHRPALAAPGEAATYTDEGDFVWLKRGNLLHICSKVKVLVEAPEVDINASNKVAITAPLIVLNGAIESYDVSGGNSGVATFNTPVVANQHVQVNNSINATGDITDKKRAMDADRAIYNQHVHGTSPTPTPTE